MHASPGERLRRRVSLLLLLAACRPAGDAGTPADSPGAAAAPAEVARFDSSTVTILDSVQARMIVSQCSRPSPGPVTAYWMPTPAEVAVADAAVMRALAAVSPDSASPDTGSYQPRAYRRQYAGLVRGGERILYVNGIAVAAAMAQDDTSAWRRRASVACDGGGMFFGAEYDPATRRVGALHFNGPG